MNSLKDRIRSILPRRRPDQFIERLTEQSAFLVQGGEALAAYMSKPSKKDDTHNCDKEYCQLFHRMFPPFLDWRPREIGTGQKAHYSYLVP